MTDETPTDRHDRSDAIVVRWTPKAGDPRRLLFEPAMDGFRRVEQVRDHAGEWRTVGSEPVAQIGFENVPPESVDGYDREASAEPTTLTAFEDEQQSL